MNTNSQSRRRTRTGWATLVLAGAMLTQSAPAYVMNVNEIGPNLFANMASKVETAYARAESLAEYSEQAARWAQTLDNWRQRLAQFQQVIANPLLPTGLQLKTVPDNYMIREQCGTSALSISGIASMIGVDISSASITEEQQKICVQIQYLENLKHNETVAVVSETMPGINDSLNRITQMFSSKTEGAMRQSTDNALQSQLAVDTSFKKWDNQMKLYQMQIDSLRMRQRALAREGLKGSENPLGTIVKTAALKAALSN